MPGLVAIAVPAGPAFVELISDTWAAGDAFAPVDPRLPQTQRQRVLEALKPTEIVELVDGSPQRRRLLDGAAVEAGDALVIATSGTEGDPKAVIHTHDSVLASAQATSAALDVDPARDRWLCCLPLAHIGGLSVVLRSLVSDTPLIVHDGFNAADVDAAAHHHGVTLVSLVTRALNQVDISAFRHVLIGGAAPPPDLPDNVTPTYGMTETGSGIVYGSHILDGCEIAIVDQQGRTITAPDVEGEIQVRGPMLFRGYRSGPAPFTDDGWFPTGDLGRWTTAGTLKVSGRQGDVIVSGGENVWPGPIEELIATIPGVTETAVIGRPDADWGHRVVAVIVCPTAGSSPTLDEVRRIVLEEMPVWCAPKELVVVDRPLPRTSLGKLQRRLISL